MNDPETRNITLETAELRADFLDANRPVIRGIALKYGSMSLPLRDSRNREFTERFHPGAFSRALSTGADVRALVNHNKDLVLGRNKSGTLRIFDEPEALRFELDPPDTALAKHYVELVRRGDITGVSFRFYKLKDSWSGPENARVRDVHEADIDDISIVTHPAYPDTEAAARSLDEYCRSQPRRNVRQWAERRLRLAEADN
jgi:uncharacterized protein